MYVDVQAHQETENQVERRADRHADDHHERVLHVGDIGRHTGDKARYAELVDVGK